MSLISDALKKAQNKRNPVQNNTEISANYLAPDKDIALSSKKTSVFKLSRVLFFLLITTALGLGSYYLYVTALVPKDQGVTTPSGETIDPPIGTSSIKDLKGSSPQIEIFTHEPAQPLEKGAPVLTGVMYMGSSPQAVINGIVLNEGDIVAGYTVSSIFPSKVILRKGNKDLELYLR